MNRIRKYVLTGGPCVGKTTVINIFAERGFSTVPEVARAIIERELEAGSDILPWKNTERFQHAYAEEQRRAELTLPEHIEHAQDRRAVFMDRSIIDGQAFCVFGNVPVPEITPAHVSELRDRNDEYDVIFILDPLERYEFDDGRVFKPEESLKLHELVREAYEYYGFQTVRVPLLPPEDRADYILSKVREFQAA
ncbi:MAG TPA: ATP-binding protein [Candidatus Paceibacterota bacterium]